MVKVKVKLTLQQARKAQREREREREQMYSSTLPSASAQKVGSQRHALAALPQGNILYPLYRRLGGPQGRAGQVRKIGPPYWNSIPGPSSL